MPTLDQWREWRRRCALARCEPETREALRLFGWQRFRRYAGSVSGPDTPPGLLPDASGCWHLLETRLATAGTRQGKRYKDWLFDRAGGEAAGLDAVQGGASLLVRDVVRDFLRRECPHPRQLSLDAPAGEAPVTGPGLTLADLLPGPADTAVEARDLRRLAVPLAAAFFDALPVRERLVVLARHLGIPLYHPAVESLAGVRKSRVATLWQDVFRRLAARIHAGCAREERAVRVALCLLAAAELDARTLAWGRLEKQAAELFLLAEDTYAAPWPGD